MDVGFTQTDATVMEAVGNASLILSVVGQLDTDVSVSVQVMSQDGTAIGESEAEYCPNYLASNFSESCTTTCQCFFLSAGSDYSSISSTLNLTSSTTMMVVLIPIIDDSVVEMDEQFTVVLSSSDPNVLTSNNQATVTIVNDNSKLFGQA